MMYRVRLKVALCVYNKQMLHHLLFIPFILILPVTYYA